MTENKVIKIGLGEDFMIIGIDIDDVIANTYEVMFFDAQKFTIEELKRNGKIHKENLKIHMYCSEMHNWNKEETIRFLDEYYESIMKEVKPIKYASDTINKLKEEGNTIYLITARFKNNKFDIQEITKKWLSDNNVKYDKLFLNCDKKANIVQQNNVDVFIDDSFKNCKEVSEVGVKTYIFNNIINEDFYDEKIDREYSWTHLYQEIKKLKEEN